MNAKISRNLLSWFRRWWHHTPARHDAPGWDQLIAELRGIIPEQNEPEYRPLYLGYLRMLEDKVS